MKSVVVVGACAGDYVGISEKRMLGHDSNPGSIALSSGGVGRNIAESLYRLGIDVGLVSAVGNDQIGKFLQTELANLGIGHKLIHKNERSGCYLAIHDHNGDLVAGVNDFSVFDSLTVKDLEPAFEMLDEAKAIVLECNFNHEVLAYLVERYNDKQIFVDGVSQAKIGRLLGLLDHIFLLKANISELSTLSGIDAKKDFRPAVGSLLQMGLKNILLTSGAGSINLIGNGKILTTEPSTPKEIVSTTGAGDGLFAGFIAGLVKGLSLEQSLELGKRVASIIMSSAAASNPLLFANIIDT